MYPFNILLKRTLFSVMLLQCLSQGFPQETPSTYDDEISNIIAVSNSIYGVDLQLANGHYFEDLYRGASGHPYFVSEDFFAGKLDYCNKIYEEVSIKYDIYEQRVLAQHEHPDFILTSILIEEFLSEFVINGMHFKKLSFSGNEAAFYQVIEETEEVRCYYKWFKTRKDQIRDNQTLSYNFSGDKCKKYLELNGVISRYTYNRSFCLLFSEDDLHVIRDYLKSHKIKVNRATDKEMKDLIIFCQGVLNQRKMAEA